MSLARTALRLQVIQVLLTHPVLGALVQGRVYDSRIDALDAAEPVPTILVYTETSRRTSVHRQNGGAPYHLACNLVLEIAITVASEEGGEVFTATAGTDREAEGRLDLIEEVAILALCEGDTPAGQLLREAVTRIDPKEIRTERFATAETREKFALFVVTIECELKTPPPDEPFALPSGPFAALPEPLRSVAAALPEGSALDLCLDLVASLAPASPGAPAPIFAGVDMALAPQPPNAADPPDRALDEGAGRIIAADLDPPSLP